MPLIEVPQTKVDEDAWNQAVLEMEKADAPDPGAVEATSSDTPRPPAPAPERPAHDTPTTAEATADAGSPSRGGA